MEILKEDRKGVGAVVKREPGLNTDNKYNIRGSTKKDPIALDASSSDSDDDNSTNGSSGSGEESSNEENEATEKARVGKSTDNTAGKKNDINNSDQSDEENSEVDDNEATHVDDGMKRSDTMGIDSRHDEDIAKGVDLYGGSFDAIFNEE